MDDFNLILATDSYKTSHVSQYPPGTSYMHSYLESRGGDSSHTVFFGLQYYLKKYLSQRVTMDHVEEAATFCKAHGVPFNYAGWKRIAVDLEGKLPVRIRAVPEGTVVPIQNVLMTVESTDPETFWIVSYLETLLMQIWYPISVCTRSYDVKKNIKWALELSSDNPAGELAFKLHDFGARGVSSQESAMIGGAAHLVNFMGSDTMIGIRAANKYYNHPMAGFSIPASEHSTITMWGRDREAEAYANMLEQYKDAPIFACVSDSYNIHNAAENIWGGELKDRVIAYNGTLVVRPDSGHPITSVVTLLNQLERAFGTTPNSKGCKVLNHNVRIIQGDGIDHKTVKDILECIIYDHDYSATNIAFGMGGGLLQQVNRDTHSFAFKCSAAITDRGIVDVYKDPVQGGKASKRGLLELVENDGNYLTVRRDYSYTHNRIDVMRDVYFNGEILVEDDLETIRKRAAL